jgi:hypothetical protein
MIEVKCYGGPAHGRTMNLDDAAYRFEMFVEPRIDRRQLVTSCPPDLLMLPLPRIVTNTYYLQTYAQEGITECRSVVFRHLRVAIVDGADLLAREKHELEHEMDHVPWLWKLAPSILHQFEAWWEKALHDQGWERAIIHY